MNLSLSLIQFAVLWQPQMLQVRRIKLGLLGHLSFLAATWVKSIRTNTEYLEHKRKTRGCSATMRLAPPPYLFSLSICTVLWDHRKKLHRRKIIIFYWKKRCKDTRRLRRLEKVRG